MSAEILERPLQSFDEEMEQGGFEDVAFQADAALIRELGERLVGAPHIALAELIKNAYDADATVCKVILESDRIIIADNGHGMREKEFRSNWMRIGTINKRDRGQSFEFGRAVTGSKGVGRLSAQFLAHRMQLVTVAKDKPNQTIHALVDWDKAVIAGDLTKATAKLQVEEVRRTNFPEGSKHGTEVLLEILKQSWSEDDVKQLGRQLWMLNSPMPRFGRVTTGGSDPRAFIVEFKTDLPGVEVAFAAQMRAAIDAYHAVVEGTLVREPDRCVSHVKVRFRDGETFSETFAADPLINSAKWQIRIYDLIGRQPSGVSVSVAREYFEQFGVMVFDAGFRLPFYGIESDWLSIDYDHAHRLSRSALLPQRLQTERGLNDLPQQGRMLGVVTINTGEEARAAGELNREHLQILVTRDRLVHNLAYEVLKRAVRQSLDLYAINQRRRKSSKEGRRPAEPSSTKLRRIDELVNEAASRYRDDNTISALRTEITSLHHSVIQETKADEVARALLGPLAAAGMAALAMEHENRKAVIRARSQVNTLSTLASRSGNEELRLAIEDLSSWLDQFEAGRRIFAPLLDTSERERVEILPAIGILREVVANLQPLLPNVSILLDLPRDLELPAATFAEWHALFQNVLLNAGNAMLDVDSPAIRVTGGRSSKAAWLRISDVGCGVDLAIQATLFEPFERRQLISEERRALGLGGMGLGLTIVRMIAEQRGCLTRFVAPELNWTTTFELIWASNK